MPTNARNFKSLQSPEEKFVFQQTNMLKSKAAFNGYESFSKEEYAFFVASYSTILITTFGHITYFVSHDFVRHLSHPVVICEAFSTIGHVKAGLTFCNAYLLGAKDPDHPDILVLSNAFCKMEPSITERSWWNMASSTLGGRSNEKLLCFCAGKEYRVTL